MRLHPAVVAVGLLAALPGLVQAARPAVAQSEPVFEPRPGTTFPVEKQTVQVGGANIAYVEIGDPAAAPILFLHGIPTSSYLWRNILPGVAQEDRRLIAMDLVGFGDSAGDGYGVLDQARHVARFVEALALDEVTLVTHDWGAGIGLLFAAANPDRVVGFATMEGALPPVYPRESYETFGPQGAVLFRRMRAPETGEQAVLVDNVWLEAILPNSVARPIQPEVHDAYRAAFPTAESRRPILEMTRSLPIGGAPADVTAAYSAAADWWRETRIPKLVLYATPGRLQPERLAQWAEQNLKSVTTAPVGPGVHFIQEDSPLGIARALNAWLDLLAVSGARG